MINLSEDIQSLSHFKRDTVAVLKQLKKTGRPMVLTVNGKAKVVVLDADSFQHLQAKADQIEMREFLEASRADIAAGRTEPIFTALEEIVKTNKAKLKAMK